MLCVFVILAVALQIVVANPRQFQGFTYLGSIPKSEDLSTKTSYYLSNNVDTWINSFNICASMVGRLVSPVNPVEDDIVRSLLIVQNFNGVIWTSARKTNNIWEWTGRETNMLWSNFHSPTCRSNTGCAAAYTSGCKWAWCGENCNNNHYYICEF